MSPCPVSIRSSSQLADLAAIQRQFPERYPCLLESVSHGAAGARFDILFAFPGQQLVLEYNGTLHMDEQVFVKNDFLESFERWWQAEYTVADDEPQVPFYGGWFVYLSYELVDQIEPSLALPQADTESTLPKALAIRFPAAIIRDHLLNQTLLVAERASEHLLDEMEAALAAAADNSVVGSDVSCHHISEDPGDDFLLSVERTKQYIVEGDVFQVNLSRQWQGRLDGEISGSDLYQKLCLYNPAPFAGLFIYRDSAVISSSPERLVRVHQDGLIETRPIAGTHPRSAEKQHDAALSHRLMKHPKERAEHIMLIDLERNDLGRVCIPGSVSANELMVLESYAHVHHIVSNIRGQRRTDVSPADIIRAVFPGGTITGCPKIRCMEIISELERAIRGPYTGSMGYINTDGSMDLNILIRTLYKEGSHISLRAGAGIVADSIAERELAETRAKARGLLLALEAET